MANPEDTVFLQVRHPLDCIASLTYPPIIMGTAWQPIVINSFVETTDEPLLRAMKHWLYWNAQCESLSKFTYQVESFPDALPRILKELGKKANENDLLKATLSESRNLNTTIEFRDIKRMSWKGIMSANKLIGRSIQVQASLYGYE